MPPPLLTKINKKKSRNNAYKPQNDNRMSDFIPLVLRNLHIPPRSGVDGVGLSYICIPNRSKIRSYAKTGKTDGNFTKYGVQPQEAD